MFLRFGVSFLGIAVLFVAIAEIRENVQAKYVTALETPVSLFGIVTSPRFHTGLSTTYDVYIRFTSKEDDPRVVCRLQYARNDKRCRTVPPILDATWELLDDRRGVAQGHAPRRLACCSFNGNGIVDANLGWFDASAGHEQSVRVTFHRDARVLRFANPRLVVEANPLTLDLGQLWILSAAVLAGVGTLFVLAAIPRLMGRRKRQ